MAINRTPFFATAAGLNGAGAITVAGTQVGDIVISPYNITGTVVAAADTFERSVSVAGQVQQNSVSNLSGNTYLFLIIPQGWKSVQ